MTICVLYVVDEDPEFDRAGNRHRREWPRLLGRSVQPAKWSGERCVSERGIDLFVGGISLVVIHESSAGGPQAWTSRRRWLEERRFYVLLISGDAVVEKNGGQARTYRRRAAVRPRTFDEGFAWCFARFLSDLEDSGIPHWQLLEPPDCPEHLCSLYLLIAASDAGMNVPKVELPNEFWERVGEEWLALGGEELGAPHGLEEAMTRTARDTLARILSASPIR
jgi:hypothetical protein